MKEDDNPLTEESVENSDKFKFNYDKHYKLLFFIPLVLLLISLVYLGIFYSKNGEIIYKDVSLSGGTSITING